MSKFPKYPGNTELIYWWKSMIPQVLQDIIDLILLTIGPLYREGMKYGRILWKAGHYALVVFPKFKSRWPGVFCRKAALKIFAKSKETFLYQSAFCNNVMGCRSATLSERDSDTGTFLLILQKFSEQLFCVSNFNKSDTSKHVWTKVYLTKKCFFLFEK